MATGGVEDINGTVITTRSYIAQHRDTTLRFLRAFTRGMHRDRTDKTFSKKVLGKYGKINGHETLGATWQRLCANNAEGPSAVLEGHSILDRESVPGKEAAAEAGTVRRVVSGRALGKERLYRFGKPEGRASESGAATSCLPASRHGDGSVKKSSSARALSGLAPYVPRNLHDQFQFCYLVVDG